MLELAPAAGPPSGFDTFSNEVDAVTGDFSPSFAGGIPGDGEWDECVDDEHTGTAPAGVVSSGPSERLGESRSPPPPCMRGAGREVPGRNVLVLGALAVSFPLLLRACFALACCCCLNVRALRGRS